MLETLLIILLTAAVVALVFNTWRWREQLADKDKLITTLEERTTDKARLITSLEEKIAMHERTIANMNAQVLMKEQEAAGALTQLAERDQTIAAQQQAQAAQAERIGYQKALMLTLANASYDGLIVVDREGKIIAINDTSEAIFACVDAPGKSLQDVTHTPDLVMMVDDALTNEEETFEAQMIINQRNYKARSQVIKRDGHFFIALALADITQLVRLNRARRDMVANISHELRTPIANIRLIIDSLFHDQDKPKRKDSITSLREIAKETDNLLWLVQEMSDLSMIESGQAIVRMVENHLGQVVEDAFERMKDQSAYKDIQLVRHVPEKMHILCDRDLVQRVLVNLIHNALKWSPDGEAVTVSAHNGGDEITIRVLDNGPGVPPDAVDRIFERFYQIDASRSGGEGSGLGLAICRHIVEAHGGRIWAEPNSDGAGGRFVFTLLSAGEHDPEDDTLGITPLQSSDNNGSG